MQLKDQIFALRQLVAEESRTKLSVGHCYELLATALSYDTLASLTSQAVVISLRGADSNDVEDVRLLLAGMPDYLRITHRHGVIGAAGQAYPVALAVQQYVLDQGLVGVPIEAILLHYENSPYPHHHGEHAMVTLLWMLLDLPHKQLRLPFDMLEEACTRIPALHYPILQLYLHVLDRGVEGDDAVFTDHLLARSQYHLYQAAAGGHPVAMLDSLQIQLYQGSKLGEESFIDLAKHSTVPGVAARAAGLAEKAGLTATSMHWSGIAAPAGDLPSMRRLVLATEQSPTVETWTWIYLSMLMGEDVRASTMKAPLEGGDHNGEENDDDIRGGLLCAPNDEELRVPALAADLDEAAQVKATELFKRFEEAAAPLNQECPF